ncbi:hypothetical protein V8G54_032255 [Vigna mungo]|uniref:F-box domain-containing protein n=1 Tax=Vigna mungo TaxID=3915 RepID=A0AAQ3ML53_VIGMU
MANDEMFVLQGEMSKVLSLMKKTFYSNEEIFLLELINNASNALDKIQFERLTYKNILDDELIIILVPHEDNKTLSIIDSGIGMSKADLAYNFGVGFCSSYLVAHKVIVTSKHNDHDQYIWESQLGGSFIINKDINAQQPSRGTNITLFLKDNQLKYMEETTIKNLVLKNCQHISHPIYLWNTKGHWQLINHWLHNQERNNKFVAQKLMNHLPDDLLFSILSKLPLKSLKRFGCLQRSWNLFFENSHFMNLFRNNFICNNHSFYDNTSLLLILDSRYVHSTTLYSFSDERFQNMEKIYWPNQLQEDHGNIFYTLGSSSINGIICLYKGDEKVAYLWNPSYNEVKIIPPSPFEPLQYGLPLDRKYQGFGYDCVRDDYIVIRNVSFNPSIIMVDLDDIKYAPILEMYSLRSNSWKKLERAIELPVCYDEMDRLYFEGMCHWLGGLYDEIYHACLVSFDLSKEVFITTMAPSHIPLELYDNFEARYEWRHIFILNGSIALMSNYAGTIYIEILAEVGKKETWTQLLVFGPIPCIYYYVGSWNIGNILFQTLDGEPIWLNLSTQKFGKVIENVHCIASQLVVYKKSLVRLSS